MPTRNLSSLLPLTLRTNALPLRTNALPLATIASNPAHTTQLYVSTHSCPFRNLALENHLLTQSHPDSTILFLYSNHPSIVIGRNQNPWLEVDLSLVADTTLPRSIGPDADGHHHHHDHRLGSTLGDLARPSRRPAQARSHVPIVRRRSGGGTVFHDPGNVNYSVICPPAAFSRDRHAEMVVRALHQCASHFSARVNERHDIVARRTPGDNDNSDDNSSDNDYKVSGSAYKLTRLRALHHGTCLLRSPNLGLISRLLRSGLRASIKAQGVESVRSPVANLDVGVGAWERAVVGQFVQMYGQPHVRVVLGPGVAPRSGVLQVDEGAPEISADENQLLSSEWVFGQTPRFTFSGSHESTSVEFEARHGVLSSLAVDGKPVFCAEDGQEKTLYSPQFDWHRLLRDRRLSEWLDDAMGSRYFRSSIWP